MKIAEIRVRDVSIPRVYATYCADPDQMQTDIDHAQSWYQIVEISTESGLVGLGEVSDISIRMNALPADALQDFLSDILVGGNLDEWRNLCDRTEDGFPADWHPELKQLTRFGIEIALLDLVGKRYGIPLFDFLGGRYHRNVTVSWVAFLRGDVPYASEMSHLEEEVREKTENGIRSFKLKIGEDHERNRERVRLVRSISGADAYIKVDASGAWEETEAIAKLKDMAAAGADACETPIESVARHIATDDPERINGNADEIAAGLARVRAASPLQIIEHVADLGDVFLAALIRHRSVDVINVVASQAGGVMRSRRLIETAQTAGIRALLGSTIELGPGTAAFVHLAVASRNVTIPSDIVSPELLVDDVCTNPFAFKQGSLSPGPGPGIGMELDEARMDRWMVR